MIKIIFPPKTVDIKKKLILIFKVHISTKCINSWQVFLSGSVISASGKQLVNTVHL